MTAARRSRYPRLAPLRRSRPAAWIDAVDDWGLLGWLYWPNDLAAVEEIAAFVNGEAVAALIEFAGRPDVPGEIGVAQPVHSLRIDVDVHEWGWDDPVDLALRGGDTSLEIWSGTAGALLASRLRGLWSTGPSGRIAAAVRSGFSAAVPPPGLNSGAATPTETPVPLPAAFFGGEYGVGPRADLAVSRFQEHWYYRHVRDHPGFRTERHFPAATHAGLVDYLVWALRAYAGNFPYAPLPVGPADAELLNAEVTETGLGKGKGAGLVRSRVGLTAAQVPFIRERHGELVARDEDELADWMLEWLGSWGWGHKGLRLMTPGQVAFLTDVSYGGYPADSLGAGAALNRYVRARLREHTGLGESYSELHVAHVRIAAMCDVAASDLLDVGSEALLPPEFLRRMRQPETATVIGSAGEHPDVGVVVASRPVRRQPAGAPTPQVRVLGMLESKSGLGQNARNSVRAVAATDLSCATFSLAINDRSVPLATNREPVLSGARVNLWHLNPDNLPEAVTTVAPEVYADSYNIGFFAWELDQQPRAHRLAIEWVDEIWVPSTYCEASFRSVTDKPITVMPHAVEIPAGLQPFPRAKLGLANEDFLVHCSFDMHSWPQRKNPLGAIRAFQRAFDDDHARLLLKIRNGHNIGLVDSDRDMIGAAVLELAEEDDRILIDVKERSYSETLAMIAASDCHISLHRSEGFGYILAEAMALGVPLVCTDYGGSRDFCNADNSWLVPAEERLLEEGEYYLAPAGAKWGEPDIEVAVRHLIEIREGASARQARVEAARASASALDMAAMSRRYGARLRELLA